jgi:hypothetical protein
VPCFFCHQEAFIFHVIIEGQVQLRRKQVRFIRLMRVLPLISVRLMFIGLICGIFFLSSPSAVAWDLTLAWDPNQEPDLDGYAVYYTKYSPGPPYDYAGDIALSELADPNAPAVTLTDLEKHIDYYFALTAYDAEGNESSFSQELCVRADDTIHECAPAASDSLSGGGSNHNGSFPYSACFIQAASDGHRPTFLQKLIKLIQ